MNPTERPRPVAEREQHLVLLVVASAHPAAGLLHQHGFMIEMLLHELPQPRHEKFKLDRLAVDRSEPPIRYREMVRIDHVMAEQM